MIICAALKTTVKRLYRAKRVYRNYALNQAAFKTTFKYTRVVQAPEAIQRTRILRAACI